MKTLFKKLTIHAGLILLILGQSFADSSCNDMGYNDKSIEQLKIEKQYNAILKSTAESRVLAVGSSATKKFMSVFSVLIEVVPVVNLPYREALDEYNDPKISSKDKLAMDFNGAGGSILGPIAHDLAAGPWNALTELLHTGQIKDWKFFRAVEKGFPLSREINRGKSSFEIADLRIEELGLRIACIDKTIAQKSAQQDYHFFSDRPRTRRAGIQR